VEVACNASSAISLKVFIHVHVIQSSSIFISTSQENKQYPVPYSFKAIARVPPLALPPMNGLCVPVFTRAYIALPRGVMRRMMGRIGAGLFTTRLG
jgi:hypothetical protein